jgi:FkbM family methyltransferase
MSIAVNLDDFIELVYGKNGPLDDALRQRIQGIVGKDVIESMEDIRAVTMSMDRQSHPTPLIVRFSEQDIRFAPINGIECPVDRFDLSVSAPSAFTGSFEPHLIESFKKVCRPSSIVLDIGANVGYHTLFLSQLAGESGRVYAFEPNSENYRIILLGAEHNLITNIILVPIALSDSRGWAYFSSHIGLNGGLVSQQFATLQGHGTVVPTFKLDDLSLPNVDVIKIDVEGAEYKALKGGEELLVRSRPAIFCEFSMEMVQRVSDVAPADFLEWIVGMDYKIFILDRNTCQPVPVDSLSALFAEWSDLGRIEDLLFLPPEKTFLLNT